MGAMFTTRALSKGILVQRHWLICVCVLILPSGPAVAVEPKGEVDLKKGLVCHWPLAGHVRDVSGQGHDAVNRGADLKAPGLDGMPGGAAGFDGRGSHLEAPMKPGLRLGKEDFSLAVWVHTAKELDDVPG